MISHPIKEIKIVTNIITVFVPQGNHPPHNIEIAERFNNHISMYIYHKGKKLSIQFTKKNLLTLAKLVGEKE